MCSALTEMGFPVWSRAISAKGTVKATLGSVNIPVVCAGVASRPAMSSSPMMMAWSSCRARDAAKVAAAAEARVANEEEKRRRLAAGELGPRHVQDARGPASAGLTYVDSLED